MEKGQLKKWYSHSVTVNGNEIERIIDRGTQIPIFHPKDVPFPEDDSGTLTLSSVLGEEIKAKLIRVNIAFNETSSNFKVFLNRRNSVASEYVTNCSRLVAEFKNIRKSCRIFFLDCTEETEILCIDVHLLKYLKLENKYFFSS